MKKTTAALMLLTLLVAVLIYRAGSQFPDRQLRDMQPIAVAPVDADAVARRLGGAIRIPTVSYDERSNFDADAFLAFHDYLETNYPLVHQQAPRQVVNGYSVYRFVMTRVNPGTMKRVHGVDEQIAVDDYVQAISFYHALLGQLADEGA